MGRIIRVGSGQSIPAQNTNMGFRMTKLAPAVEEAEIKTEYVLNILPKWISIFSNTSWESWYDWGQPHATWWNIEKWISGDQCFNIELKALSDCFIDFRPTKCRFEFSKTIPSPPHLFVRDIDNNIIADSAGDYVSMTELDMDFSAEKDIYNLYAPTADIVTNCTKIEFYGLMN